jgi:NAD/NADP transhydrogenase alpha subunit
VAIVPAVVSKLVKKGFAVNVEENAGALANFPNKSYEEAGAKITSLKDTFQSSNLLYYYTYSSNFSSQNKEHFNLLFLNFQI